MYTYFQNISIHFITTILNISDRFLKELLDISEWLLNPLAQPLYKEFTRGTQGGCKSVCLTNRVLFKLIFFVNSLVCVLVPLLYLLFRELLTLMNKCGHYFEYLNTLNCCVTNLVKYTNEVLYFNFPFECS